MRYCIDIDGTLCSTAETYEEAQPLQQRIDQVNQLYRDGHEICIWTTRGKQSGQDYRALTERQLERWGVQYHELSFVKPSYDVLVDDKVRNVDALWRLPDREHKSSAQRVPKGWGHELIFANEPEYCGKVLHFEQGKCFSMHYHVEKKESWYVASGRFLFHWIDTAIGEVHTEELGPGCVVTNQRGAPHQLHALEAGDVFEVSTHHCDEDSYRIWSGDR